MKKEIVLITMFLACIAVQARTYIVCVGISDYPGTEYDRSFLSNDARAIRDIYQANGDAETFLTTDERATVSNVRSAMKTVFGRATSQDAIVFFFSGHGSTNSFLCYDGHILHEEIIQIMDICQAKRKFVMASACHSGSLKWAQKEKYNMIKNSNVMFLLSARPEEYSWGYEANGNSIFTSFLAKGLRGAADANKDSIITARELFLFVNRGVRNQRIAHNNTWHVQHPVMWGRFDHQMPVMSWKKRRK